MGNRRPIDIPLALVMATCYALLAFAVKRYDTLPLLSLYGLLFALFAWIYLKIDGQSRIMYWVYASMAFRFVFLFSLPMLSDDYFRFIWDGRLLLSGHHPFSNPPMFWLGQADHLAGIDQALFDQLNSKNYFTVYPPLAQYLFAASVWFFPQSVGGSALVLKAFAVIAEAGSILFLKKLLERWGLPLKNILLYALNPLAIVELVGNLHLEVFMIMFVLGSIYFLGQNKVVLSAFFFSCAIGVKLLPLMLMPMALAFYPNKKGMAWATWAVLFVFLMGIPLWDKDIIMGYSHGLGYYFSHFEFNASLYYLVREVGYWAVGFNVIQYVGWAFGAMAMLAILLISYTYLKTPVMPPWKIMEGFLAIWVTYVLCSTTVHPWYILPALAFSVFSPSWFMMAWTFLIFLTYGGYSATGHEENMWIVGVEYFLVGTLYFCERIWKKSTAIS